MTEAETVRALFVAVARRLDIADRLAPAPADDLLMAIAATAVVALEAQAASIAVRDAGGERLVFRAAAGPAAGNVVGLSIDASAGIAGYAVTSGQPLAVADAAADPRFDRSVAEATGYVPSTLLAAPLIDDAGTVGVLEALDRRGGSFSLRDLDVAAAIAREATLVVRAGMGQRDAATLLASSLRALGGEATPSADIDGLVATATRELGTASDEAIWPLIDRIARLREVDPDAIQLATEWLDALLRHAAPRRRPGG
jgi:signal transduction protein with GAF and PtsI domain